MSESVGVVVKFKLKPGHEKPLDKLVGEMLPLIKEQEPGTLIYTYHRVDDVPRERLLYELYRDRKAFDIHEQQPYVRRFLAERLQHLEREEATLLTLVDGKGLLASS